VPAAAFAAGAFLAGCFAAPACPHITPAAIAITKTVLITSIM
jgi:hypothetical protein